MSGPRLLSYIATRDRRLEKSHSAMRLLNDFERLMKFGHVTVGGRASCGSGTDPSWTYYTMWHEIVRKARGLGMKIYERPIKQTNAWATKCGGFWHEEEYSLKPFEATTEDSSVVRGVKDSLTVGGEAER